MNAFNNNQIYTVNYSQLGTMLTPPLLRTPAMNAWTTSLLTPNQSDNQLFTEYLTGSTYPYFSAGTAYIAGDRAIYTDDAVYQNLTGSTGVFPTDSTTWLQVNPSYIGAEERVMYNSQKIVLEWALNRQYQILPNPSDPTIWSGANHTTQIYIGTNNVTSQRFIISTTETYSSDLANTGAQIIVNGGQWMGSSFTPQPATEFTVWVPNLTQYTGITNTSVYQYVQNYIIAGITCDVQSY